MSNVRVTHKTSNSPIQGIKTGLVRFTQVVETPELEICVENPHGNVMPHTTIHLSIEDACSLHTALGQLIREIAASDIL